MTRLHPRTTGVASIFAAICDMNGVLRGKRLPAAALPKVLKDGTRMPMSSIGVDIWGTDVAGTFLTLERGDLDGVCLPTNRGPLDLGWSGSRCPLVPLWMQKEDGSPYFADGRHLLADVITRYASISLTPVVATEVEFYLLDPAEQFPAPAPGLSATNAVAFDSIYSIEELADHAAFLDDVYRTAEACDIQVEAATAEGAPRQFEFNLVHQADAVKAADDTLFFRQIIRNAARRHGYQASFMAKPLAGQAGSGLHVHFSVLDAAGRNVFDDGTAAGSDLLRYAVGGLLDAMAETSLAFAPHLNSYRRLTRGGLAPTRVAWGYENRTSAVRIPAGPNSARRIEHRVAGADANPYVVLATILGSALRGIDQRIEPPVPVSSNSHELDLQDIARDWRQALDWFAGSSKTNGILHPEFVAAFAACKHQEQDVFAAQVTDFELTTYRQSL
ncbi:glutamine synthetase family protein [Corticibacterium sp. UT-5YL-CI-8]|nr:glutamine synthetase family protein [Tianweitania sp. UT-5YL-CI-8]